MTGDSTDSLAKRLLAYGMSDSAVDDLLGLGAAVGARSEGCGAIDAGDLDACGNCKDCLR